MRVQIDLDELDRGQPITLPFAGRLFLREGRLFLREGDFSPWGFRPSELWLLSDDEPLDPLMAPGWDQGRDLVGVPSA